MGATNRETFYLSKKKRTDIEWTKHHDDTTLQKLFPLPENTIDFLPSITLPISIMANVIDPQTSSFSHCTLCINAVDPFDLSKF